MNQEEVLVKKSERTERMNKLKLLRMFAKNPSLKDTGKVLQPAEEAALLTLAQEKAKDQQSRPFFERSRLASSQEAVEVPMMQKFQITSEIDDYKKLAFKRTTVSQFLRANAYKRNKASASSLPPDKEKDNKSGADTGGLHIKKPNFTTIKNEIVEAVVARAAGVSVQQNSHSQHRDINIGERFKLELSKTQKGDRKFLPPSIFQKDFDFPVGQVSKVRTKAGVKAPVGSSQVKEKEIKEKIGADAHVSSSLLSCLEPAPPTVNSHFATANDFNFNLQQDQFEEHTSTYRAFNSYVQFCNKVYWGPNQATTSGVSQGLGNGEGAQQVNMPSSATLQHSGSRDAAGSKDEKSNTSLFIQNLIQQQVKTQNQKSRFQLTAFDILFNPLRKDHPFEDWSPKEISKFQACFLIYGKAFGEFRIHLPRKSYSEIQEFYRAWKHTPFYKEWKKQNKQQKPKRNEETITEQLFL